MYKFLLLVMALISTYSFSKTINCEKESSKKFLNKSSYLKICKIYDVNSDGNVDQNDISFIQKQSNKSEADCKKCDLNKDGKINTQDSSIIIKFMNQ